MGTPSESIRACINPRTRKICKSRHSYPSKGWWLYSTNLCYPCGNCQKYCCIYAKYVDESSKNDLRNQLIAYDRNLLVSDPRRCEPKKYGGRGARARFQKSYR